MPDTQNSCLDAGPKRAPAATAHRLFASRRKLGCIALEAGFSNAKTFNAAFQKHYQCSAGQFRKHHIEKEAEND